MKTIQKLLEQKSYICNRAFTPMLNSPFNRLGLLVQEAISRMQTPQEYQYMEKPYFLRGKLPSDNHYRWSVHEDFELIVVSGAIEKSNDYSPVALFPINNAHLAAEFFIWIISTGEVQINWSLFIDL
jgi:hypothetical protein